MRLGRIAAATTVAAMAAGAALLISTGSSTAATPPPPTKVNLGLLNALGMSSAACPLPLNGSMAITPGTQIQFEPDALLSALQTEKVTISPDPATAKSGSSKTINPLTTSNGVVAFPKGGTYKVDWQLVTLGVLGLNQTGKLVVSSSAEKCVVAVSVPTPSVSIPGAGPVNSIVNGVVGSVVGGVNGLASPVNSLVGPVLGGVNSGVGGLTSGQGSSANSGSSSHPTSSSSLSTIYTPSGLTPAQQRVPVGGGAGGGAAAGANGQSINAPDIPFKGIGAAAPGTATKTKSGGSPKTVDLAANKPRSALDGWANLIVLLAVLALSGATAFYARTYLLHPLPAKVPARS